ncbi:MAG: M23 family metallopeptidase [Saprospiraceae bacterium]|nr:M23 family metallopeptidase [Saprospiraceae bacterium]
MDFALPAGTTVRAPVDSTVLFQCDAGNYHRSIKLRASNGQIYSLLHVTAASVKSSYRAGERIGTVAADKPWNNCARSTGPHIHMALPAKPFVMGGYTFGNSIPTSVTSR